MQRLQHLHDGSFRLEVRLGSHSGTSRVCTPLHRTAIVKSDDSLSFQGHRNMLLTLLYTLYWPLCSIACSMGAATLCSRLAHDCNTSREQTLPMVARNRKTDDISKIAELRHEVFPPHIAAECLHLLDTAVNLSQQSHIETESWKLCHSRRQTDINIAVPAVRSLKTVCTSKHEKQQAHSAGYCIQLASVASVDVYWPTFDNHTVTKLPTHSGMRSLEASCTAASPARFVA